jgi:hypothetical protein
MGGRGWGRDVFLFQFVPFPRINECLSDSPHPFFPFHDQNLSPEPCQAARMLSVFPALAYTFPLNTNLAVTPFLSSFLVPFT